MQKEFRYNTIFSFLLNIVMILSGFILPRLFLTFYGSVTNGLISSMTQFLNIIAFLDMGTTAVVGSTLYRPIVEKKLEQINQIMSAAHRFFKKIAYILIIYVFLLAFFYPTIAKSEFDWTYTTTLIFAIAISSFAQYYSGLVDQIFLSAAQKEYIYSICSIVTIGFNTISSVILINIGASIQIVKIFTSFVFLLRPIFLRYYVNRHYHINRNTIYGDNPIPQRWSGIAQHIAFKILNGTDVVVLTLFCSLESVSIYTVYNLVLNGIRTILLSLTNGIKPKLGYLWVQGQIKDIEKLYRWYEWVFHMALSIVMGCAMVLVIPFVKVYTLGVNDANYIQPVFSVIITMASMLFCTAQFGVIIVQAVNHYKETQMYYIISASLNVVISVLMVIKYGLCGVAIGTLVAMLFQQVWTQAYMAKKIFNSGIFGAIKLLLVDILILLVGCVVMYRVNMQNVTYTAWLFYGIKCFAVFAFITIFVNIIMYKNKMLNLFYRIIKICDI